MHVQLVEFTGIKKGWDPLEETLDQPSKSPPEVYNIDPTDAAL